MVAPGPEKSFMIWDQLADGLETFRRAVLEREELEICSSKFDLSEAAVISLLAACWKELLIGAESLADVCSRMITCPLLHPLAQDAQRSPEDTAV